MKNKAIILKSLVITFVTFTSCEGSNTTEKYSSPQNQEQNTNESEKNGGPNSSPETVMNTIFNSAKNGEVGVLRFLLPPNGDCDGDCIAICNPGNERMREELGGNYTDINDFMSAFSNGKIIGQGTPLQLMQSSEPKVKQFMHGEADGAVPFHYPAKPYMEELLNA